jgi:hypothetical protein
MLVLCIQQHEFCCAVKKRFNIRSHGCPSNLGALPVDSLKEFVENNEIEYSIILADIILQACSSVKNISTAQ